MTQAICLPSEFKDMGYQAWPLYVTAHDAAAANHMPWEFYDVELENSGKAGVSDFNVVRVGLRFDTAPLAIPPGAVIDSIKLKIYSWGGDSLDNDDNDSMVIVDGSGISSPMVATDFHVLLGKTISFGSKSFADIMSSAVYDGAHYLWNYEIALNPTGIAAINLAGETLLALRTLNDINNVEPTGWNDESYMVDYRDRVITNVPINDGYLYEPQLVIDYHLPPSGLAVQIPASF